MHCPFCQAQDTKVIDSRLVGDGTQIRRRRECELCKARFTTFETADLALPRIIKSDGERQPFNGTKLKDTPPNKKDKSGKTINKAIEYKRTGICLPLVSLKLFA